MSEPSIRHDENSADISLEDVNTIDAMKNFIEKRFEEIVEG